MDIAIVIPELAKYGGAERLVVECAARWQHQHRLTLYSSRINEDLLKEHRIGEAVRRENIHPYFEVRHSTLLNCVLLPKIWEQQIGRHDVYHTHLWPTHLIDLHPMVWYPHEPLRVLYDLRYGHPPQREDDSTGRRVHLYPKVGYDRVRDSEWEATLESISLFDTLGAPERIVANSRYSAKYLQEVYGREVPDVVYPGTDMDEFAFAPDGGEGTDAEGFTPWFDAKNIFLTVGQLWPHKRVNLVIEAVELVEDVQLYVVGSGPEKEHLREMVRNLGLSDRVFFLEGLTNFELRLVFGRCLGVVFVPLREPFGIVAIEAMAAGKPLIGANEGGFTEVVDESCAMLVPPRPGAIAEAMRRLKQDKDLASRMALAGREKAKQLSWDRTAAELVRIIEETCARSQRERPPAVTPSIGRPSLFGVQYYCWYGEGMGGPHWNDNPATGGVTDVPELGHYASGKGYIVEKHLAMMEQMGLDFAILNLHVDASGVNRLELAAIRNIFGVAASVDTSVRFAVQLCPYDCGPERLKHVLDVIGKDHACRDHYLRMGGRPVLFVFWTAAMDGREDLVSAIRQHASNFIRIGAMLTPSGGGRESRKAGRIFHGRALFSPLDVSVPAEWERVWRTAYEQSDAGDENIRVITVSPGYDDSHLKDPRRKHNPLRRVDRLDGQTYQRMIDFALSSVPAPHMIIVSTFNEYHENTHIEPSLKHGRRYFEMTRALVRAGKEEWRTD